MRMSEVGGVELSAVAQARLELADVALGLRTANWPLRGSPAEAYLAQITPMLSQATAARQLPQLVDALTATLAVIMIRHGSWAAGDVLGRLGEHMCRITNERTAEKEAVEERVAGREPH